MLGLISAFKLTTLLPTQSIYNLAMTYINEYILTYNHFQDALQIACATLNNMDYLLTFNLNDMHKKSNKIAQINLREGYPIITICKPSEV
jgi:hypothetical protein